MNRFIALVSATLCFSVCFADEKGKPNADQIAFFESKIRPIFVQHCYECHSAESGEDLEGGLLLDSRNGWFKGGDSGPAIIPGNVNDSLVVEAIRYQEDLVSAMPPKSKLPDEQIKLIEKWIEMGAPDPREATAESKSMVKAFNLDERFKEHWSWRPIRKPDLPTVNQEDWGKNDIDRFVLAQLSEANIKPAKPADKRTWIRRVYFDLIGLPPTTAQVDAYLADQSDSADANVVDELLNSPHFGEKWARHWMDLVRYAESFGHEFDYPIEHASHYRDYLIRAFNADVPYDQFVREHIAGDLIDQPRRHPEEDFNESIIGTGFWFFHEATHAPTDVLQNEADITDNQIDVFGKAFLGLTVACARCHDHKFDAISTADYYALTSYIQSSCKQFYPLDRGRKNELAVQKLEELRREYNRNVQGRSTQLLNQPKDPADYFAAAKELFSAAKQAPRDASTVSPDAIFEAFEDGFDKWTIKGDAFGQQPQSGPIKPQVKIPGQVGKFAGSFVNADRSTGTLTSKPFMIRHSFINFLVGGGKRNVYLELIVDGRSQLKQAGADSEDLIARSWDVRPWIGREAVIKIVDNHRGGWGHINVDQIVFSNQTTDKNVSQFARPTDAMVTAYASENGLNPETLRRWITRLVATKPDKAAVDPFALLAYQLLNENGALQIRNHQLAVAARRADYEKQNRLFIDFDGEEIPVGWSTSGLAFQPVSHQIEKQFLPLDIGRGFKPGTIDSAAYGRRASGILRTPTFEITHSNIHVLMNSTANTQMRVVIDNYQMAHFNALLFRGTDNRGAANDTKGQWAWKSVGSQLSKYVGHKAYLEFIDPRDETIAIDKIWLSNGGPPPAEISSLAKVCANGQDGLRQAWKQASTDVANGKRSEILDWLRESDLLESDNGDQESVTQKAIEIANAISPPTFVIAMAQGTTENANVYVRGNPAMLGEEVFGRNLTALGGEKLDRLSLANKIASRENPLAARVIVNRIWHHLFGVGIVPTVDDFGPQGQPPSHPELLDTLAIQMMDDGWSTKSMIRKMVLSNTYRQSSVAHPDNDTQHLATADPTNQLLHRMRVRRLPAESIRDAILAVSGRLDPKQFGPSIATHRTEFMTGRGARGSGPRDGAGRRSVYLSIYRNFLNPFLMAFDMPSPFGPKGRRSVSNVPAQALTLMNDPFVIEQAKLWSKKTASQADTKKRIEAMIRAAHSVQPANGQVDRLAKFVETQQASGTPKDAVWADLAHTLFNMKAFYFLR